MKFGALECRLYVVRVSADLMISLAAAHALTFYLHKLENVPFGFLPFDGSTCNHFLDHTNSTDPRNQ